VLILFRSRGRKEIADCPAEMGKLAIITDNLGCSSISNNKNKKQRRKRKHTRKQAFRGQLHQNLLMKRIHSRAS
jgi:hypothetical protein